MNFMIYNIIIIILQLISLIISILIAVAYITLAERKVLGAIQKRKGPNVVGYFGILQPLADGIKLFFKESIVPKTSNKYIYLLSPVISFFISLIGWVIIPFDFGIVISDLNVGILYILCISSFGVYGIILAGWSSNSRYAFLGALRSAAQMISYEVSIGLIIMNIVISVGSLNLTEIVVFQQNIWFIFPFFPLFVLFFVSCLAETNRPPFDLTEAESELVAGYNVEYSGMGFALFFLAEYSNIIFVSIVNVIFFFGGWLSPFGLPNIVFPIKVLAIIFLFIWVRSALPRYRYDQLMRLGWKIFLPLSILWVLFSSIILLTFNWLPN